MAESWGQVCRQCVDVVADVPISVLLVTVLATFAGLMVLVSRLRLVSPVARGLHCSRCGLLQTSWD